LMALVKKFQGLVYPEIIKDMLQVKQVAPPDRQ
jgi:hypothetical protein